MATRNRTPLFRKYRDALRHVRAPAGAPSASSSSSSPGGGPAVVEMASLLRPDRNYAPLSTDDPSASSRSPAPPPLPLASRPRAIEILTHEITDLLKRSEKKLQKLSMKDSSEDSNVRKNVQTCKLFRWSSGKSSQLI
uniref:Uncharacterized protein n=1 Tax=Aegilops tauschii subsp. strangulata TaxID=200361 RepID=A0A453QH20_AEGTS